MTDDLRLDSVFTAREVPFLLLLLERLFRFFVLQREGICCSEVVHDIINNNEGGSNREMMDAGDKKVDKPW